MTLYEELYSFENLKLAFQKAAKGKSLRLDVMLFSKNAEENLRELQTDLMFHSYKPKPLQTFILRDPKTRKISKSNFRDRIIHHALCNIIEPLFEKNFIFDSYANRKSKGVFKALERFDNFKRKISRNNTKKCFVLKADIKHYFETVDHNILLNLLKNKINDRNIIWLIEIILKNYSSVKGMPLGNLTSQFFANIYLNELDQYVKHQLKVKYYIRYVDDFVILHASKEKLEQYQKQIDCFLKENLQLELHPDKSRIIFLQRGVDFLGMRMYYYHRLLKKRNINKFKRKYVHLCARYEEKGIEYDFIGLSKDTPLFYGGEELLTSINLLEFLKIFQNF